jgi:hypothetical protein
MSTANTTPRVAGTARVDTAGCGAVEDGSPMEELVADCTGVLELMAR